MNKEELSRQYADQKVEERGEYTICDFHRRKSLTKFDGYDIEQAFEDGLIERDKHLWKDAQGDDLEPIKNKKCNPTNTDWVVFVLSVLFTILTCDNITKSFGEWFKIISCIIVLLGAFYFVTRLFCFWVKKMTS